MNSIKLKAYYDSFSIITIGNNKRSNFPWKKQQEERLPWEKLLSNFNYSGGIIKKSGEEIPPTKGIAIVTGFEDLEVMDVDLKVFSTAREKKDFWDEYLGYLRDNILDFDEKFAIYKTQKAGYHILYKTKRVEGNLKIAKLKNHKEYVLETRGLKGYVVCYPDNKAGKNSYFDINYISDEDRDILFSFSKMYDYKEPEKESIKVPKKTNIEFSEGDITPWDDFNAKNQVWDVVSDQFKLIRNLSNKYIIKRNGADSAHSGYIFKDHDLMYLHSTGTVYPHETQLSAYAAFTWRYHQGDFSASASDLYHQGFGSRIVKKKPDIPKEYELVIDKSKLEFPIGIFPKNIQDYLLECSSTLNMSIDYLGCSLLWLISLSIGNSMQLEVKRGWREIATIWIALVGKPGIGKTPAISMAIKPLKKANSKEIAKYINARKEYEHYESLTKKEKEEFPDVVEPMKTQFIANDITLEALVALHEESDNAVGVFKDELAGWFKDMNKYRAGSDLEFWLSTWSGDSVNINRMTRAGSFISKPLIPVLGGIQPRILNSLSTDENKENGFLDRMLLAYPELKAEYFNDKEMTYESINWYNDTIISFFETIKNKIIKRNDDGEIDPKIIRFSKEAKTEWKRIDKIITDMQNSDEENEYMKSMLPKQLSYIPRFSLLLHVFNAIGETGYNFEEVSKESILKAESLSKYFIEMSRKVRVDSIETSSLKNKVNQNKNKSKFDQVKALYEENKDFNRSQASEILDVSRRTVINYVNKIKDGK